MGWCFRISLVLLSVISAVFYNFWFKTYEIPKVNVREFWGRGSEVNYVENENIYRFQINYADQQIAELRRKLSENYTFTPSLDDAEPHEYGIDTEALQQLIAYWKNEYLPKWSDRLALLNSLPHYKTQIQGLNIHFIHAKPDGKDLKKPVIPILLIHGWPGSVREFYEFIPMLINSANKLDVTFEVIAPSLPGFGWSDPATRKGLSTTKMSIILRNLMLRLGHKKFLIQGGDWGSSLGSNIATLFPENVLGYHSNMCVFPSSKSMIKLFIASFYPSAFIPPQHEHFSFPVKDKLKFILANFGYFHLQATKPDTIGNALIGHPVGLAAYIGEKFSKFIDTIGRDAILDNLMIYYLNNIFTTAGRIYAETMSVTELSLHMSDIPTDVPTACARFYVDINHFIDWQLTHKFKNLIQSSYYPIGGHFAAFEVPDILYHDFREFVKKLKLPK